MKNFLWIMMATFLLAGCNSDEKEAAKILNRAENSFYNNDFNKAKMQIDSIKMVYPKAFEVRKAGISLMQKIDLEEQNRTLVYLDSMLALKQQTLDDIKKKYILEKDAEYQEVGNYFYPTQTVEKNATRSFLRAQVSEMGEMFLTSIYTGKLYMHHDAIRVSVGDTFAETPASPDRYESTYLGRVTEKCDYKAGQDGGVIGFIIAHKDKRIRLEYIGKRKYTTTMQASDVKAVVQIAELARILSSMDAIRKEQKEAQLKVRFITRKMQESAAARQAEAAQ